MFKTSTLRAAATLAAMCLSGSAWALGSTPVTVVNPADIAKAEGIQHPYQAGDILCNFSDISPDVCEGQLNAPATQRLVIEFVSAACGLVSGVTFTGATMQTTAGNVSVVHSLAAPAPPSHNIGQQVRIYVDPASTMFFTVEMTGSNLGGLCTFSLSGQAIAVP